MTQHDRAKEILIKHLLTVDMMYSKEAIDEVIEENTIEGLTLRACFNAVEEALNTTVFKIDRTHPKVYPE